MDLLPIAGIVLVAAFTQGVIGFGFGLLAMAILPWLMGFHAALAFVALFGLVMNVFLVVRYRRHFDARLALPLVIGGVLGVPLGFLLVRDLDPVLATKVLGALVVAYAAFELRTLGREAAVRAPTRAGPLEPLGVGLGMAGGILGAAFNTGGPPVVMYGTLKHWSQGTFKATIQAYFFVAVLFALVLYGTEGYLTAEVLRANALLLPVLLAGIYVGVRISDHLDGESFRRLVLLALLVLGLAYLLR